MRRPVCSQVTCRPWKSNVLPLLLFDALRNTVTRPSSSIHRRWTPIGTSLHTRYFPWLHQAGPSDQLPPVQRRWMPLLFTRIALNAGSMVMMSWSG
jgi:hypothetical protein